MKHFYYTTFLLILLSFSLSIHAQHETWPFPFSYNGKWGIVDNNRQELVAPTFDTIAFFWHSRSTTESAMAWQKGRVGLINRSGEWLVAPKMDSIHYATYHNSHLYRVIKKGRWGIITTESGSSKWLLKPKYKSINMFEGEKEMLSIVTNKKGTGVVNSHGKMVLPCQDSKVDIIHSYSDYPIIEIQENGKKRYRDYNGVENSLEALLENIDVEMDIAFEDSEVEEMPPGMAPTIRYETGENGETIIVYSADYRKERVVVPAGYAVERIKTTSHFIPQIQYVLLSKDGKFGFMNPRGEIITPVKFDKIEWDKYEYHALLHLNGKVGFTNHNGEQIIPAVFTSITPYNSWYFKLIHPDGYVGFTNSRGKIFLPSYVKTEEE